MVSVRFCLIWMMRIDGANMMQLAQMRKANLELKKPADFHQRALKTVVPTEGLEPPHPKTHGPEPCASTNSATWATEGIIIEHLPGFGEIFFLDNAAGNLRANIGMLINN